MKETWQQKLIRWGGQMLFWAFILLCGMFGVSKLDM
jgi:hypothetical protein